MGFIPHLHQRLELCVCIKLISFDTKFIMFHTQFINFNANRYLAEARVLQQIQVHQFLIGKFNSFDTKFIILNRRTIIFIIFNEKNEPATSRSCTPAAKFII